MEALDLVKTNALFNLIRQKDDNKIHLYVKTKIKKDINILLKTLKQWSKMTRRPRLSRLLLNIQIISKYANNMQDIYKNIEEYKPERRR